MILSPAPWLLARRQRWCARIFLRLPGASLIRVEDTLAALGRLAAHWRTVGFAGRMAGITGSSSKTSVRKCSRAILVAEAGEDAVLATAGNLNNDIGVPLTLLRLRAAHRFAVIEMGMNHPGEIRYLASRRARRCGGHQ